MIVFPNCKINLGLHIVEKRADGYHNLETVFYPIPWCDALEWIPAKEATTIHTSGYPSGPDSDNLVIKAYKLLKRDYPFLKELEMWLHKAIPPGAGLGGGSSDGAHALQMLAGSFHLKLSDAQLNEYALQLGSDCPFFLRNRPCIATGRGEILEEIPLSLSGYKMVLVHPEIHISTREAFLGIQPAYPSRQLEEAIMAPISDWKDLIFNDFEKSIFPKYPLLSHLKDTLYEKGAIYASMSGSGSTLFGIFPAAKAFTPFDSDFTWKEVIIP
ncbi:MAG: 4-(cytidine 5'-diphospho)-2-C-methyl-D-erythritol kinase [Bacteroidota bacterium]|nr:4-(cytidine 5'-diphospho)-2-C-methyl-D-erythritol kinase [Bacteroidota bacterium]